MLIDSIRKNVANAVGAYQTFQSSPNTTALEQLKKNIAAMIAISPNRNIRKLSAANKRFLAV